MDTLRPADPVRLIRTFRSVKIDDCLTWLESYGFAMNGAGDWFNAAGIEGCISVHHGYWNAHFEIQKTRKSVDECE